MKHHQLITATICLLAMPIAKANAVDLRGPELGTEKALVTTTTTKSEDGFVELTPPSGEYKITGSHAEKSHHVTRLIVTKQAEDSTPSEVEETFLKSKFMRSVNVGINGNVEGEPNHTKWSWKDAVLTSKLTDKGWTTRIKGMNNPVKYTYLDARLAYPANPCRIGLEWQLKNDEMANFFRQSGLYYPAYKGKIKLKLIEIKQTPSGSVAVISYDIHGTGEDIQTLPDRSKLQQSALLIGKGRIERRLDNYTESRQFAGDIEKTYIRTEGNRITEEITTMRVKTSVDQELEPIEQSGG